MSEEELGLVKLESPSAAEEGLEPLVESLPIEYTSSSFDAHTSEAMVTPVNDPEQSTEQKKRYPRRTLLLSLGTAAIGMGGVYVGMNLLSQFLIPQVDPFPVKTQRFHILQGHMAKVTSVAFSPPDGRLLASGSWDKAIKVWNAYTGELHSTYEHHDDYVSSIAWTSDGKYLASGSYDRTIKVVNIDTGRVVAEYTHEYKISSVAWSYDDRYLAAAGIGKKPEHPTIKVWDTKTNFSFTYANDIKNIHEIAWKPESDEYLASATDYNKVYVQDVYHLDSQPSVYSLYDQVNTVAWSPKHRSLPTQYLAAGSGNYDPGSKSVPINTSIYIWNTMTESIQVTYKMHKKSVNSVSWSPSGKYIVSGGVDNLQVWEAMTGQPIACYTGHASYDDVGVDAVAWSPAGDQIASAGGWTAQDATIHLWSFLGPLDKEII